MATVYLWNVGLTSPGGEVSSYKVVAADLATAAMKAWQQDSGSSEHATRAFASVQQTDAFTMDPDVPVDPLTDVKAQLADLQASVAQLAGKVGVKAADIGVKP